MSEGLVAGGAVRVLRGGADPVAHVNSPVDGSRLAVAGLLAGEYVARDDLGTEHAFTVEREGALEAIPIAGASSSSPVSVVATGGDLVDVIPGDHAKHVARAEADAREQARKDAGAKRPARKRTARKRTAAKKVPAKKTAARAKK